MSDQDKSTGSESGQSPAAASTESSSTPSTRKVTKKKVTTKKAAKKKASVKNRGSKKATAKKRDTGKKVATNKATGNNATGNKATGNKGSGTKTTSKKASKKAAANGAAAREAEKQAVSNALRAALSAGGNLMKPADQDRPLDEVGDAGLIEQDGVSSNAPIAQADLEIESAEPQPARSPADEEAARQVEKKAVNDAILAAINASGSLMRADGIKTEGTRPDADQAPVEPSMPLNEQAADVAPVPAEPVEQQPAVQATPLPGQTADTSTQGTAESPARNVPDAVPEAVPVVAPSGEPGSGEPGLEQDLPRPVEPRPRRPGIFLRMLLLVLCLVAALLYAKILAPGLEITDLVPGFEKETRQSGEPSGGLRPLPESQMQVIRDVFAPELRRQEQAQ